MTQTLIHTSLRHPLLQRVKYHGVPPGGVLADALIQVWYDGNVEAQAVGPRKAVLEPLLELVDQAVVHALAIHAARIGVKR